MTNLQTKQTASGLAVIVGTIAVFVWTGLTFGWWAVYGFFWALVGLVFVVWIGGMLLFLARDIGTVFFPNPPKHQPEPEEDQMELPFD